jgi:hypothetical protein
MAWPRARFDCLLSCSGPCLLHLRWIALSCACSRREKRLLLSPELSDKVCEAGTLEPFAHKRREPYRYLRTHAHSYAALAAWYTVSNVVAEAALLASPS